MAYRCRLVIFSARFDDHRRVLGTTDHGRVQIQPPGRVANDQCDPVSVADVWCDSVPQPAVIQEHRAGRVGGMGLRRVGRLVVEGMQRAGRRVVGGSVAAWDEECSTVLLGEVGEHPYRRQVKHCVGIRSPYVGCVGLVVGPVSVPVATLVPRMGDDYVRARDADVWAEEGLGCLDDPTISQVGSEGLGIVDDLLQNTHPPGPDSGALWRGLPPAEPETLRRARSGYLPSRH